MSGKLICADGTVVQISKETEQELRKAFEPKPARTYMIGDVFWRNAGSLDGTKGHYFRLVLEDGRVGLQCVVSDIGFCRGVCAVGDITKITHAEVEDMTCYPEGLRLVEKFKITEEV